MKKGLLIGSLLVVLLAAVGFVGVAFAQSGTPDPSTNPYGMHGYGMMGGGRWARSGEDYGPMHEYMVAALAEAFDMTPEELQAQFDQGKTAWDIAQEQGLTEEQFYALMVEARTTALQQMVAEGVITQEQADWMLSHMGGFGGGFGPCHGNRGPSRGGPGGRWNSNPTTPSTGTNS